VIETNVFFKRLKVAVEPVDVDHGSLLFLLIFPSPSLQ
jgi:hypothetical protein